MKNIKKVEDFKNQKVDKFKSLTWEVEELKNDPDYHIVISVNNAGKRVNDLLWMKSINKYSDELNELNLEEVAEGMIAYNGNLSRIELIKELINRGFNAK